MHRPAMPPQSPARALSRAVALVALTLSCTVLVQIPAAAGPVEAARLYLRGSPSVRQDLPKAFNLFRQAANAGDPQGAYYLGLMYRNGMAVARDATAAAHWLRFAADRDLPAAMYQLAQLYLSGEGVKRDEITARRWIEKAAELDYPEAVMAMAIGLRDGSMGFDRNEALSELQMKFANQALQRRAAGM